VLSACSQTPEPTPPPTDTGTKTQAPGASEPPVDTGKAAIPDDVAKPSALDTAVKPAAQDTAAKPSTPDTALTPVEPTVDISGYKPRPELLKREFPLELAGPIDMGAPFADNAVLQRDKKVPVWGWAKPGTKITVKFASQTKTATAGENAKWMLRLDELDASFEPREMVISDDAGNTVKIKNILVGEVWMCSGQSNMQWKVTKSTCNKLKVEAKNGVAPIREFEVASAFAQLHPIERASGSWKNGDYTNYSAIAFAFAHKLYGELGVPIGILNCAFSTTKIQAWIPRVGFEGADDEYTRKLHAELLETDPTTPEHQAAWDKFYSDIDKALAEKQAISTATPGNMHGNRDSSWLFNGRLNPVTPYALSGGIWNQGYASQGEGIVYYNNLHSLVRGWRRKFERPDLPVYFHQFYSAGYGEKPNFGGTADMRMGAWLARDIPGAGMASQIDITGGIHYYNKAVPGQRMALHALKNQYGKDVVAEGPMFKSYKVEGNKLIVEFSDAEGGLVVGNTEYNTNRKNADATGFADPKIIPNADDKVKLFWLADADRVWHQAKMKIDGTRVILTAKGVGEPRGVSYATGGVGKLPNLYNKGLLPASPFIYYDQKLVTRKDWPDEKLKIAGEVIDPATVGKLNAYRKMPILSTQFRDGAVLQAGVPVTIWGSTRGWGEWQGAPEKGDCKVHFEFGPQEGSGQGAVKKTIAVTPDMAEWRVTIPAMKAGPKPHTLKVSFTIDGELAHERALTGIVFGDVWYVGAPAGGFSAPGAKPSGEIVRMSQNQSKRDSSPKASRFSVCVSRMPRVMQENGKWSNRFAAYWKDASGLAGAIGHSIAAKTGHPVGIIFMQTKSRGKTEFKHWIKKDYLDRAPRLVEDCKQLLSLEPGNKYYNANARRYVEAWKKYWGDYIVEMMVMKRVPDDSKWGHYPGLAGNVTTDASRVFNVMVSCFGPANLKGIVFLADPGMVKTDQGANFGPEMSALANGWKDHFTYKDAAAPHFFYTIPSKALAPKVTKPESIKGKSTGVEIGKWEDANGILDAIMSTVYK